MAFALFRSMIAVGLLLECVGGGRRMRSRSRNRRVGRGSGKVNDSWNLKASLREVQLNARLCLLSQRI